MTIDLDDGQEKECPQCGEDGVLQHIYPGSGVEWIIPETGRLCATFDEGEVRKWIGRQNITVLEEDMEGWRGPESPVALEVIYHPDDDGDEST